MKKLLSTAAFMLILASGTVFAQTASNDLDLRAATLTRDMSFKLGLNESDYIRLKNINREKLVKADEVATMYKNDMAMRNQKLSELQNMYDSQLQSFLNSKQMAAYATYKTSNNSNIALEGENK